MLLQESYHNASNCTIEEESTTTHRLSNASKDIVNCSSDYSSIERSRCLPLTQQHDDVFSSHSSSSSSSSSDLSSDQSSCNQYVAKDFLPQIETFRYWLPKGSKTRTNVGSSYHNMKSPPKVCLDGKERGNTRILHPKAWLEVCDSRHRYGKHLRMYYKHWKNSSKKSGASSSSSKDFFDWLDRSEPLPNIPECPRSILDSDTVQYLDTHEDAEMYRMYLDKHRGMVDASGKPIKTGPAGWMFVVRDLRWYGAPKITNNNNNDNNDNITNKKHQQKRFHHSSFFGGAAVQSAGIFITNEYGKLIQLLPHSGHYRPDEADVQFMLHLIACHNVSWNSFHVDAQQFWHTNRTKQFSSKKQKKVESLILLPALEVADYLHHKAFCLTQGIFCDIHERRMD